jgi:hypothetical protein
MTYHFSGVFAKAGESVLADVQTACHGDGRIIEDPFEGFGVAFFHDRAGGEPLAPGTFPLVPWSTKYPEVTFVYVWVECWGGGCEEEGFVFRNGEVVYEDPGGTSQPPETPLRRLLQHIGVDIGDRGIFAPLGRGYFSSGATI